MKNTILISILIIFSAFAGYAQESFFNTLKEAGGKSPLSIGGKIDTGGRYMINPDALASINVNNSSDLETLLNTIPLYPYAQTVLNFKYSGDKIKADINLSNNINESLNSITGKIDEAYIHFFSSPIDILAGYTKVVWGKGDGMHVIDRLNANDYRDFINQDYLDRRVSELMLKLGVTAGETGYFEFAYEPVFTPDLYPEAGIWLSAQAAGLQNLVSSAVEKLVTDTYTSAYDNTYNSTYQAVLSATGDSGQAQYAATQAAGLAASAAAQQKQDEEHLVLPDTDTLLYSQFAGRYTFSAAGVDLGFSDYFGFLRNPVIDTSSLESKGTVTISYDRVNTFGLEASTVFLGFNTWMEAAYNLTPDYNNNEPMVHNNSIQYLAGFDRDLPIHNLYMNIQIIGSYILGSDKIENGDIEYKSDAIYTNNTLAWFVSDTFFNELLKLEFDGAYNFEHQDYILMPKADFAFTDDLHLIVLYTFFNGNADTDFGQYKNNDFAEIKFVYTF
ncbi:MAG: hypothetical protein GXP33_01525 [Spirochaetes bacterium]|nr:hypothetical protein [Spirochaetota bacterium]